MRFSRATADLLLLAVALLWGGTFVIVRDSVRVMPPLLLIGGRFLLALLALVLIFPRHLRDWRANLRPGLLLAGLLMGGFVLQTYGLRYTTASTSGFITGLNVVFVALTVAAFRPGIPSRRTVLGVILATTGLACLSWLPGGWQFGRGDWLTLACAVFFALHIVVTGLVAPGRDPVALTVIQFAAVTLASLGAHAVSGAGLVMPTAAGWFALVYLGLAATAFAFLMQTAAQRHTPAVDTAIIFSTEPLFAAAIAVLFGGKSLPFRCSLVGVRSSRPCCSPSWDQEHQWPLLPRRLDRTSTVLNGGRGQDLAQVLPGV